MLMYDDITMTLALHKAVRPSAMVDSEKEEKSWHVFALPAPAHHVQSLFDFPFHHKSQVRDGTVHLSDRFMTSIVHFMQLFHKGRFSAVSFVNSILSRGACSPRLNMPFMQLPCFMLFTQLTCFMLFMQLTSIGSPARAVTVHASNCFTTSLCAEATVSESMLLS